MPAGPPQSFPIAALLLAAGGSTRLGTPKQLLRDETGVPLVARAASQLLSAGCGPVIVVTGAAYGPVSDALTGLAVTVVHNPAHREGMGSSIRCGVWALTIVSNDVAGVLIAACDMPQIDSEHYRRLCVTSAHGIHRTGSAYMAERCADAVPLLLGIPAVFPLADFGALQRLSGDRGARALLAQPGTRSVPSIRCMFDLDTPSDVAAWRATEAPWHEYKPPGQSVL